MLDWIDRNLAPGRAGGGWFLLRRGSPDASMESRFLVTLVLPNDDIRNVRRESCATSRSRLSNVEGRFADSG
jgi:hypothetical protein